jgi:hypothetical protein
MSPYLPCSFFFLSSFLPNSWFIGIGEAFTTSWASQVKICWKCISEGSCSSFCYPIQYGVLSRTAGHHTVQTTLTKTFTLGVTLTAEYLPRQTSRVNWYLYPLLYLIFLSYLFILLWFIIVLLQFFFHLFYHNWMYLVSTLFLQHRVMFFMLLMFTSSTVICLIRNECVILC